VTENSVTYVKFNFTAFYAGGVNNLDDNTAQAKFNRSGEGSRTNSSCTQSQDIDSNSAVYNCTIQLWYFDGAGDWGINVTIQDLSGGKAENSTTGFILSESTCMVMSPPALTWPSLAITNIDTLSNNDPIALNNTCNDDIDSGNVKVKAINLIGEQVLTDAIFAGNFSVHTADSCNSGTTMVNGTSTGVSGALLAAGNHSLNNGVAGQEQLYVCLEAMNPDITPQSYSTGEGGAWTVTILFAAFRIRRKKKKLLEVLDKKLKEEYNTSILEILDKKLKEEYNIDLEELSHEQEIISIKKITVPIEIFKQNIGPAESLTKYLKENKELKLSKIAELLSRDQRTVGINYRNAKSKMKEKIVAKEREIVPVEIFSDRKLSVLESLVYYLRNKGMTNAEISKILNKDQRNTWTLYSRAIKKQGAH
ncbi:MAG: hypothetical protein AABX73_03555, partial [Nanoarchaeota archaeon]